MRRQKGISEKELAEIGLSILSFLREHTSSPEQAKYVLEKLLESFELARGWSEILEKGGVPQ